MNFGDRSMKFTSGPLSKVRWKRLGFSLLGSYAVTILMYLGYFKPRSMTGGHIEIKTVEELIQSGIVLGLIVYLFPLGFAKEMIDKKVSWDRKKSPEKKSKE